MIIVCTAIENKLWNLKNKLITRRSLQGEVSLSKLNNQQEWKKEKIFLSKFILSSLNVVLLKTVLTQLACRAEARAREGAMSPPPPPLNPAHVPGRTVFIINRLPLKFYIIYSVSKKSVN